MTSTASRTRARSPRAQVCDRLGSTAAVLSISLLLTALLASAPAVANGFGDDLFETKRKMPHTNNECVGLKKHECRTIHSDEIGIGRRKSEQISLTCPRGFPHVVGWDAEHNEHVSLVLASDLPARDVRARANPPRETLSVRAHNRADARGVVVLYVGCSNQPFAGSAFPQSRDAVPGNHIKLFGGLPR